MVLFLRFVVACFMLLVVWTNAAMAGVSIERIAVQSGTPIILIKGEFVFTDEPSVLAREVQATGAKTVTFDSNGGNIVAAMAYGRAIRSLGLSTFQLRAAQCASACALAFVGGVFRQAEPGSIGVHQSSFSLGETLDGHSAVAAVQAITAQIMTYLIEMDVDPKLLQLSLSVASNDMRYLTASEMEAYKVTSMAGMPLPQVSADEQLTAPATAADTVRPAVALTPGDRALAFMAQYHEAWSRPTSQALAFMETAYSDMISFYGKTTAKSDVIGDKRRFADRWPLRAYSVRHGSETVSCAGSCTVSGVVEWFAASPVRGKMSSGAAEFTLVWNPANGRIESEIGKVIATDKNASEPGRIISQWMAQNTQCRGGSGNSDETLQACDRREAIGAKLEAVGWCYGRPGEYGYQMNWHRCDARDQVASADVQLGTAESKQVLQPSDYPATGIYRGKTILPDFRKRDRDFNSYRTRIREGMRDGPNFAGRYSVVQIGCGTGCSFVIIGDNKTGRPSSFPRGGEDSLYLNLKHQLDSRLMTTQYSRDDRCFIEYFDFDGKNWKTLTKFDVGPTDACYREIVENLR